MTIFSHIIQNLGHIITITILKLYIIEKKIPNKTGPIQQNNLFLSSQTLKKFIIPLIKSDPQFINNINLKFEQSQSSFRVFQTVMRTLLNFVLQEIFGEMLKRNFLASSGAVQYTSIDNFPVDKLGVSNKEEIPSKPSSRCPSYDLLGWYLYPLKASTRYGPPLLSGGPPLPPNFRL